MNATITARPWLAIGLLTLLGSVAAQQPAQQQPTQQLDEQVSEAETTPPGFAKLATNMGDIYLRLRRDKAPASVENFATYVKEGFYEGTIFHRVVEDFVIQGGGFTATLERKPTLAPIRNEADNMLPNDRGAVAMARTMDPHSATSQFFINVQDNMALDHAGKMSPNAWGYAVFAEVVRGMDVVDAIRIVAVDAAGPLTSHVPVEPVIISKAELLDALPTEQSADAGEEDPEQADQPSSEEAEAA